MGGLFSSDHNRKTPRAQAQPTYRPTPTPTESREYSSFGSYPSHYYHQSAHQPQQPQLVARVAPSTTSYPYNYNRGENKPTATPSHPKVIVPVIQGLSRLPLAPAVYEEPESCEWGDSSLPHGDSFRLVNLSEYEDDFSIVQNAFYEGAKGKKFKITKVERVENPFLLGCYLLKKEEMETRYGYVEEEVHFHGTKKCNVKQICENNFNWRLHGDHTGNRYGKGVSFSPISYYASHYSDKNDTDKVMFYVNVLVSNSIVGNGNMVLPPKLYPSSNSRYDTTNKENDSVAVKFSDNEFYPEFIIHYTTPPVVNKPKKKNQPIHVNPTPQPQRTYNESCDYYYYDDDY